MAKNAKRSVDVAVPQKDRPLLYILSVLRQGRRGFRDLQVLRHRSLYAPLPPFPLRSAQARSAAPRRAPRKRRAGLFPLNRHKIAPLQITAAGLLRKRPLPILRNFRQLYYEQFRRSSEKNKKISLRRSVLDPVRLRAERTVDCAILQLRAAEQLHLHRIDQIQGAERQHNCVHRILCCQCIRVAGGKLL